MPDQEPEVDGVRSAAGAENPPRVAMLTSAHAARDNRIFNKQARSLVGAGYEVVFVVPHARDETLRLVRIRAVKQPKNRFQRMTLTAGRILRTAWGERAEVYHFHDPELIPLGLLLRWSGSQVVYDVHENVPRQLLGKSWLPRSLRPGLAWLMDGLERFAARRFSAVVTADREIADRFTGLNPEVVIVRNFPSLEETVQPREPTAPDDPPTIVSFGGVNPQRCALQLAQAMQLLPRTLEAELILGGRGGFPELEREICGLPRTRLAGELPRAKMFALMRRAYAAAVMYSDAPNHYSVKSNRLFESMAVGLPIIASDFPEWREFLDVHRCGLAVDPTRPEPIAAAIQHLLENPDEAAEMGRRGRRAVVQKFRWDSEAEKLLNLYHRLTGFPTGGTFPTCLSRRNRGT